MSKKQKHLRLAIRIFTIILVATVILAGCKKKSADQTDTGHQSKTGTKLTTNPKVSLNNVIRAARTWGPVYKSWLGKPAPDFTLTDITGKQHKLSDYRGKDVLIIFWATWCPPCRKEMPHLIELRDTVGEDKLAMLAISYITVMPRETTEIVKNFVEKNKINYTVFSTDMAVMPEPFNTITSIPCSFFINPDGTIKLATEGLLSLNEIKAIFQAE